MTRPIDVVCKTCAARLRAGFDGQCPVCAGERARDEMAEERISRSIAVRRSNQAATEQRVAEQIAAWLDKRAGGDSQVAAAIRRGEWRKT